MRHFVMAVAAWSSIQFCFVPTAVKRLPMEEMETTVARNEVTLSENGVPNTFQEVPKYKSRFAACLSRMFCFYNAIWGVILQIIFVDGPFFIMRLILMFGRFIRVNNNTVFFAFKNGFSIILGIYRIWSITKHEYSNWKTQMKVTDLTNGI